MIALKIKADNLYIVIRVGGVAAVMVAQTGQRYMVFISSLIEGYGLIA